MSCHSANQLSNANACQADSADAACCDSSNAWSYVPQIDVLEWTGEYTIACDAPGLRISDLDLTYERSSLHLHGPVAQRSPRNAAFLRHEYGVGDYHRTIPLGRLAELVDVDRITAEYTDGVLTIRLPKMASAQARKIQVNVN